MHRLTAVFAGGNAKEIANDLMATLDGSGVTNLSVTLREGGNEMNPQVYEVPLPDRDRSQDEAGILPGQVLNSPLEGPGPVSRESQASLIPTPIPEQTAAQKAASKENEKAAASATEEQARVTDEQLAEREQYNTERLDEWKAENQRAAARGVLPVAPLPGADAPDLKVAVVEDTSPGADNGLGGSSTAGSTTPRRAAPRSGKKK
jgi:hypothetical protein